MSARTDLVAALEQGLPGDTYRVMGAPDVPDQIDPGTCAVRAWTVRATPGAQTGSLQFDLIVWVLTPVQGPGAADDVLDVAFLDVLDVLYALAWLTFPTAERGVMGDEDGPRWHGWRFEAQAFGTIETQEA